MRKYFLLAAAIVFGLQACDPSEKGGQTDGTVAVTSFGFYAEDNPDALQADYVVENPTSSVITVRLPYGLDETVLESLVPRFEVTAGAVVYAGGTVVESGKTALDFSSAVDLIVSSGDANAMYTVNVIIAEKLSFTKVASAENASKDFVMETNPADNMPYFFGCRGKFDTNADGEEEKIADIPVLYSYDGEGNLASVAGDLTSSDADYFGLGFSSDGTAYVAFNDQTEEAGGNMSVMSVSKGSKSYLGGAGKLPKSGANSISSLSVIPVSGNNIFVGNYCEDRSNNWTARRQLYFANYNGSAWSAAPALDSWPSNGQPYINKAKLIDGTYYMFIFNFAVGDSYMYRFEDGKWINIFKNFIPNRPDGQPVTVSMSTFHYRYGCLDFDVDSKGNIYLLLAAKFSDDAQYISPAVIRYDVETGAQTIIGGVMSDVDGSNDGTRYFSLALNDADVPYVLLGNSYSGEENVPPVYLTWIDPDTRQWVDKVAVASCNAGAVCIRFADNGTGYIGVYNEDASTYDLYESVAE